MKSILYVGATLMIGASIYGFVDYKKSQDKPAFKSMYTKVESPVDEPLVAEPVTEPTALTKTTGTATPAAATNSTATKKVAAKTNKKATKKMKKKRKLDARLFSRGGLDDEYIEPPIEKTKPTPAPEVK